MENNKVIAEFMGMTLVEDLDQLNEFEWLPRFNHSNWRFKSAPPFNKSWDWLMPVVKEIRSICHENNGDTDKMGLIFSSIMMVDIESTYKYVSLFIANYNSLASGTLSNSLLTKSSSFIKPDGTK